MMKVVAVVVAVKEEEKDLKSTKNMNEELVVTYQLVVTELSIGNTSHGIQQGQTKVEAPQTPPTAAYSQSYGKKRIPCSTEKLVSISSNNKEEEEEN